MRSPSFARSPRFGSTSVTVTIARYRLGETFSLPRIRVIHAIAKDCLLAYLF